MSVARAMKDSGVAWIGEIPQSWELVRVKDVSPVNRGASPRPIDDPIYFDDDGEYAWVRIADVSASSDGFLETTTQRLSKLGQAKSVKRKPGDLFLSIAGTVGKACITKIKACIHDGFVYFPRMNEEATKKFFFYLFNSGLAYDGLGKFGTQLNLNTETVGSILVPLLPLSEQLAIADHLDRQTALIDQRLATLAEKKAVLAELRKATIHEAVTKGSIWNAETGQVKNLPTGWVMLRIKDVAKLRSGDFIAAENIEPAGDFPVYGGNGLRGFADSFTHNGEFALVGRQGALCGNVNYASGKFWATEHAVVVRHKRKVVTRWLGEMLCCMNLNQYATASAQPGLSVEIIVNKFLPFPPFDEQRAIAKHLDQQTQQFDAQLSTLDVQAQILKELRKAIIHEAVTGKIDLSGYTPQSRQAIAA